MDLQALQRLSHEFHCSSVPGIMTNTEGFIVEVNQAAAGLFDTDIPNLKNKKLCTFVADRKNSVERFNAMRQAMNVMDSSVIKDIMMRTQPSRGKKETLRTNITCQVVGRGGRIVLMRWNVTLAESSGVELAAE